MTDTTGIEIVEVALGLLFVYLLLSAVCSGFSELASRLASRRAQMLRVGIESLIGDKRAGQIYAHPLVSGLARTSWLQRLLGREGPSYLPADVFALALLDGITPADANTAPRSMGEVRAALSAMERTGGAEDRQLARALVVLADTAGHDVERMRSVVGQWFTESMDRVTGWYKRRTQVTIIGIALVLCTALNADTLMIARTLWRDDAVRAAVLAPAARVVDDAAKEEPRDPQKVLDQFDALHVFPIGWRCSGAGCPFAAQDEGAAKLVAKNDPRAVPHGLRAWFEKLLGLLLTAAAVSLGAPFWFDVVSRAVSLRAAGRIPSRSGGEPTPRA